MAKKPSGLGRGLDDLLEDNTPSRRPNSQSLVRPKSEQPPAEPQKKQPAHQTLYTAKNTSLYNTAQPTLKSILKSNKKR